MTSAEDLRRRLKRLGLADDAVEAAWPRWWSEDAEASPSARAELRFSVARRLGLDPESLLERGAPRFLWRDEARFKHLSAGDDIQRAGIASFGRSVAASLARAADDMPAGDLGGLAAGRARKALTVGGSEVNLSGLLALAWGSGIPVVHLQVFPWPTKRMAAMAVRVAGRSVVLLAKDAAYPPWLAFYLAHELGHLALRHVPDGHSVVDLDQGPGWSPGGDAEEVAADRWALELLTGRGRPEIQVSGARPTARGLALAARTEGERQRIEPGTLALAFGYASGDWRTANGSLKVLYGAPADLAGEINRYAAGQLDLSAAGEAGDFLAGVLRLDGTA